MRYRRLGRSGALVSALALGTDNFLNPTPRAEAIRLVHAALDAGINLFDTSDSYVAGNAERLLGEALRQSGRRDDVLVATKVHYPTGPGPNDRGNSRLHVLRACEASLERLGTDHIDLYQTHRPDFDVPLAETLGALDDLVRQGKVRYIGSSTAPAWHVMEALSISQRDRLAAFTSEQSPYNLLDRRIENELVPMCLRHQVGILAWSPLAMGMLAGRYPNDTPVPSDSRAAARGGIYAQRVTPAGVSVGNAFAEMARARGFEPALLAALWVKEQPGVTAAIVGPRTESQLAQLVGVGDMTLDPETAAACDGLVAPGGVVASFFNSAEWMRLRVT